MTFGSSSGGSRNRDATQFDHVQLLESTTYRSDLLPVPCQTSFGVRARNNSCVVTN